MEAISESFSSHRVSDMALIREIRKLASRIRRSMSGEGLSTSSDRSQSIDSAAGSAETVQTVIMASGAGTRSEETIEMGILAAPAPT